jgi:hypothetical protein
MGRVPPIFESGRCAKRAIGLSRHAKIGASLYGLRQVNAERSGIGFAAGLAQKGGFPRQLFARCKSGCGASKKPFRNLCRGIAGSAKFFDMQIEYARTSTYDQSASLQHHALEAVRCARIYEESLSGAKSGPLGLAQGIGVTREGNILVVWRLDRLGRSLPHLIQTVRTLQARGAS